MNRGGESLALFLSIQSFSIYYYVSQKYFWVLFIRLRKFPYILSLLRVFMLNRCWILSDAFSSSWFFLFRLNMVVYTDFCDCWTSIAFLEWTPLGHVMCMWVCIYILHIFTYMLNSVCWYFVKDFYIYFHEVIILQLVFFFFKSSFFFHPFFLFIFFVFMWF